MTKTCLRYPINSNTKTKQSKTINKKTNKWMTGAVIITKKEKNKKRTHDQNKINKQIPQVSSSVIEASDLCTEDHGLICFLKGALPRYCTITLKNLKLPMHQWKPLKNGLVLLLKTVVLRWLYKLLYAIKDDENGNGLKFEKTCQFFQNFTLGIEKSPTKLLWLVRPAKIS